MEIIDHHKFSSKNTKFPPDSKEPGDGDTLHRTTFSGGDALHRISRSTEQNAQNQDMEQTATSVTEPLYSNSEENVNLAIENEAFHGEEFNSFYTTNSCPLTEVHNSAFRLKNDFLKNRRRLDSDNRKNYREIYSAGILPFSVKGGTVYFLLGKDLENKWSDFGGRSEVQDKGRWDVTATREFYEESIGVVMDISSMLSRLQHRKNYIKVKGKTLSGSPYYMYVVKIPYKETYKETFDNTLGFIRYSNAFDKKYLEKIDLQWVSLETIYASLEDESDLNFPLRRVFKKTLGDHLETITQFSKQFIDVTENAWLSPNKFRT